MKTFPFTAATVTAGGVGVGDFVALGILEGVGVDTFVKVAVEAVVAEGDGETVSLIFGEGVAGTTVGAQALNANPRKISKIGLANMVNRHTPHDELGTGVNGFSIPY
jgi:hypothetical protein